ncbi:ABC transporter substrate-binding protein [Microtetraspora sp. NBRC 13810]|uniref:glutamate ABC transporter substrate-binding protein n=1 Tax=Microtetraspora sp. NBRC 13810 TaxID=3030990 RepID=UPI0024A5A578|nr:glutamate ABC transporter substrate-binding protein [Microtetraspora sp. NBRC 13810]GLW12657.1 ABC transporter substrate-binding protein [Microtetraspora sp. NBRC 13810]
MRLVRAVLAVVACLAVTGCGAADAGAFPEGTAMARIQQRGVLTVGIKFDHPLFGFKDPATGRITGFDAEIARLVAKDLTGSERGIRFVETRPRQREDFLARGVVDIVLATYSITPERRRRVSFTEPYYYADQDILVRADNKAIDEMTDLNGKRVCTATGSTSGDRLRHLVPKAKLTIVDIYSDCLPALQSRAIDAISTDDPILRGLLSQHPDRLKLVGKPFGSEPYGIGVRRGDTAFVAHLNALISRFLRDGQWDSVFMNTIGASGAVADRARPRR